MYEVYPNVVNQIKRTLKQLNLELLTDPPEFFIEKKLRFYWAHCRTKKGEKVFFKSILKRERNIKSRFINEINFLETLKKHPCHPLKDYVAKPFYSSTNFNFPYLCYKFMQGKTKIRQDKFPKQELEKIAHTAKVISSSPSIGFHFIPKKPFFNYPFYKERIKLLLKNLSLEIDLRKRILKTIEQNKSLFKKVKPALAHGDYSEANILFRKNKIKLLDWEHIHLRNPLFDLVSFWVKRKKEPREQKQLFKAFDRIPYFEGLFKLALIELCLGELTFFQEMRAMANLEEKEGKEKKLIQKRRKSLKRQEKDTIVLLERELSS